MNYQVLFYRSHPIDLSASVLLLLMMLFPLTSHSQSPAVKGFPAEVREIRYLSSGDQSQQPALFYQPSTDKSKKRPLLVALHTWSGNYKQAGGSTFARWCIDQGWIFIHPNFRGPNWTPEALGSDLAVAESDVAIAEAQLGQAKVAMYITEIRAPFNGIVTERMRNIGERLSVADEVIRLVDPDSIEVVARSPLNTVNFVKEGDVLKLHNDYRDGEGSVRTIVPFGNPQSHMFEVRLNVDPEVWTVGESVRLAMPSANTKEVLAVPRDALVLRREGTFLVRINSDGTAEQVNVMTGLGAGSEIEVIGDLRPGDRVVIRGAERLQDGMTVNIGELAGVAGPESQTLQ